MEIPLKGDWLELVQLKLEDTAVVTKNGLGSFFMTRDEYKNTAAQSQNEEDDSLFIWLIIVIDGKKKIYWHHKT